jgi:RNA polymerase sigma factor FliA
MAEFQPVLRQEKDGSDVSTSPAPDHPTSTLDQIWLEYLATRDSVHRNTLTIAYQPLVTKAVRRLPSHLQTYWGHDELRSFGQDGLIKAIERWEGTSAKFEAYALKRIRGAVFDEFRRLDWVPRTIRERISTYRTVYDRLTHDLGRDPSHSEVFFAMGLDERQGAELLVELRSSQYLHLSAVMDSDSSGDTLEDFLRSKDDEPEDQLVTDTLSDLVERATSSLPPREQAIIHLAFAAGLSQEQIGDILGVSGSQVCKMQGRALRKLRTILEPVYLETEQLAAVG